MYQQNSQREQQRSRSRNRNRSQRQNRNQNRNSSNGRNQIEFLERIQQYEQQGNQLQLIFLETNEDQINGLLKDIILIKAIEYVPIQFKLLENIINFLKRFAQSKQGEIKKLIQIILQSDLLKNLLYQVCLAVYDQKELIDFMQIVQLFKDLHQIFHLCSSIADLRFAPIIYPIELMELVDQDYPNSQLAKLFDQYHKVKDGLKEILISNDYLKCPVEPVMLEFDCKTQIIGNLEKTNYLNYHYFILREDYLREFRQFIYKFKTKNTSRSDTQFPLYQEAQLDYFEITNKDLIWTIKLKQYDMDGRRRQVWDWKKSKRLTSGALLAFTNIEGYPIVFGVIMNRDTYQPNYRKNFEIKLSVRLLSRDIQQFLDLFKCTNIVIENPIIYDASISYLLSLKTIKLPFNDVIVNGSKKVYYPKYISNFTYKISFQTSNDHINNYQSKLDQSVNKCLQDYQWKSQGSLDQSQIDALKLMLSAEIALIQGPPGTGKTFCGALAVRNLLANVKLQQLPILVVCYTNHALDQFLNHIIKYVDHQDVLRLGFGCKDPNIIPLMMTTQKKKVKNFEWNKFKSIKRSIESLLDKILDKRYVVSKEDIQDHWPELYESIIRNEYVSHIKDIKVLFDCWIQVKKPPNTSSYTQFYSDKIYLSQVKQIYRYQSLCELDEDEFIDDIEVKVNEYFDSDEESVVNYFMDDDSSQSDEYSQRVIYEQYDQDSNINYMETIVNRRIPYDYKGIADLQNRKFNPWLLNKGDIQGIKDYIVHLKLLQNIQEYSSLVQSFEVMSAELKLLYQDANYRLFNSKKIIGVTITGAAKYTETLKKLDTKILIIEEAAEVLESHLISILTPNIQHLILIGDHQQLKPKLSCYELEKQYGANISLFQKLFEQGIQNVTLTCQRRMKPKFADFIRLIYGDKYQDNIPYQQENQTIDGMNSDLIYFNHSWLEERDANCTSTQNRKEGNMIIELVIYLIGCKHKQETITVLTLYLQQATYIKKVLDQKNVNNVKVQTVDNYQGEENEIVIISLVRSNTQGSIGFVKLENRINVALSRARVALYVFGNFKCIRQNSSPTHIWSRIIALAEQKKVLKDHLELCCLRHRNIRQAKTPEEIKMLSPGCCNQICNAPYPNCSHKCLKKCHFGDHVANDCVQRCEKKLACGHQCSAKCNQQCSLSQCSEKVKKLLLCSHQVYVECFKQNIKVICSELITKTFTCGHTITCKCVEKDQQFRCQAKCEKNLSCGHPNNCRRQCYEKCDQCTAKVKKTLSCGHIQKFFCYEVANNSYQSFKCEQVCSKKRGCGHQNDCKLACYQTCQPCDYIVVKILSCGHQLPFKCSQLRNGAPPFVLCQQPCIKTRLCGHDDPCIKVCSEMCSPCQEICKKKRDCGHQYPCKKLCSHDSSCSECQNKCTRQRACGHEFKCVNKCYQQCTQCEQPVVKKLTCGHTITVQCFESAKPVICEQSCNKRRCGHQCFHPCHKPCPPCSMMVPKQLQCGHYVEIQCCKINEPYQEACMNTCQKKLICGHPNQCTRPCSRPCDPCRAIVQKDLPCGHTLQIMCHNLAKPVICEQNCLNKRRCGHECFHPCHLPCPPCNVMVPKQLQCGHYVEVQCCKVNKPYREACMNTCKKKLICGHPNQCTQPCSQPCQPCRAIVQKDLPCGHTLQIMCHNLAKPVICEQNCLKKRRCGHECFHPCHKPCPPCSMMVPKQLQCGHSVEIQCCKINEPYQEACMNTCQKTLICSHPNQCTRPCSRPCDPCRAIVQKDLPCGHTLQIMCHNLAKPVICEQNCLKKRRCGHECFHPCHMPCPPCNVMVPKQLQCGHSVEVQCCKINKPYREACMNTCKKKLICGHPNQCTQPCSQPCDPCKVLVQKTLSCGHQVEIQCQQLDQQQRTKCQHPVNKKLLWEHSLQVMCHELADQIDCEQNCLKVKSCGHKCAPHPCHKPCPPCKVKVPKQLLCGHHVDVQCSQLHVKYLIDCVQFPCKKALTCGHQNKCTQPCFRDCDPCQVITQKILTCDHIVEVPCFLKNKITKCSKSCPIAWCFACNSQFTCRNLCGEPCSPCQQQVIKQLNCGHQKKTICGDSRALCFVIIEKQKNCGDHYENVICNRREEALERCKKHCCIIF